MLFTLLSLHLIEYPILTFPSLRPNSRENHGYYYPEKGRDGDEIGQNIASRNDSARTAVKRRKRPAPPQHEAATIGRGTSCRPGTLGLGEGREEKEIATFR